MARVMDVESGKSPSGVSLQGRRRALGYPSSEGDPKVLW